MTVYPANRFGFSGCGGKTGGNLVGGELTCTEDAPPPLQIFRQRRPRLTLPMRLPWVLVYTWPEFQRVLAEEKSLCQAADAPLAAHNKEGLLAKAPTSVKLQPQD